MKSLTICYITARWDNKLEWFIDSLFHQTVPPEDVTLFVVDLHARERSSVPPWVHIVEPKPSVWYGPHRLTKREWWGVASFRNTGLCLAQSEWFAVVDDRSVLGPQWMEAVRDAMSGNYVVAGTYEKTHNLIVEGGKIKSYDEPMSNGNPTGKDPRATGRLEPRKAPGQHVLGCTSAMPLEWALNVNGWDESCDSLGLEDCIFGQMLERNNIPIMYDERMKLWEDRTPGQCDVSTVRMDKGKSPFDKSHGLLKRTAGKLQATHEADLRDIRRKLQAGQPWPIPTEPKRDWWDGQLLSEFP